MAWFTGSYEETFTVDVPLEKAKAHFADLDRIVAAYVDLERSEKLDDRTLRLKLEPKSALGQTFVGAYDCRYEFIDDHVLVWKTVNDGANVQVNGRAEFTARGESSTQVHYRDRMDVDIPINRLLAKALTPIVQRDISGGVKAYLKRMRASL